MKHKYKIQFDKYHNWVSNSEWYEVQDATLIDGIMELVKKYDIKIVKISFSLRNNSFIIKGKQNAAEKVLNEFCTMFKEKIENVMFERA